MRTPRSFQRSGRLLLFALPLLISLGACSPRQLIIGSLADELAAQGAGAESDLELARDAAPYHLKLSEAVLARQPQHAALAQAVAAGFTQYAWAFVAFDAEQIEERDAAAAERLRRRAAALYLRAWRHAATALAGAPEALPALLAGDWQPAPAQVGLAYWAAAAWGARIAVSKDEPETVADLPLAIRLAERAAQVEPDWGRGALHGLLASFEAGRPGGDVRRAAAGFERAIALAQGQLAAPYVAKAEAIALPAGDRAGFEALLQQALAVREPASSAGGKGSEGSEGGDALANEIMRRRARWLLGRADDLF
ncbi:MAG: TRAP transporter TatT component family protein [Azonexus sp.]|nr:TRAP transporter TatT component family protein [Azonexus sp.]MCK6413381.1 TRAP transporter TatT component family protein [Azonexus sp.]